MNERLQKKKKSTVRELAVGSGLMALFLPVIIFAVFGALLGIVVGAAYAFNVLGTGTSLWPVLVVYGALLSVMLIFAYKFSARFALLTRRLIGLMRERRRIRLETMSTVSVLPDDEQILYEDQASTHLSSRR